jgi:predicted polyphosphate/ATP-dependent NAD kinase
MNLYEAIYQLNPTVVTIRDDVAYDANDNVVTYDKAQAEALVASNAYKVERARAYPSIQEQLDMQYWDAINGTTTWQDAINAVKTAHPKGV